MWPFRCSDHDRIQKTLAYQQTLLVTIERKLDIVATNQENIDADVQALTTGLAAILAEIELLKSQTGAEVLDFTALDAVTAGITAVTAPVEPPVDPTA